MERTKIKVEIEALWVGRKFHPAFPHDVFSLSSFPFTWKYGIKVSEIWWIIATVSSTAIKHLWNANIFMCNKKTHKAELPRRRRQAEDKCAERMTWLKQINYTSHSHVLSFDPMIFFSILVPCLHSFLRSYPEYPDPSKHLIYQLEFGPSSCLLSSPELNL